MVVPSSHSDIGRTFLVVAMLRRDIRRLSPTVTRLFSVASGAATTTTAQANGPFRKRKLVVAACGIAAVSAMGCGYLYAQQHTDVPLVCPNHLCELYFC